MQKKRYFPKPLIRLEIQVVRCLTKIVPEFLELISVKLYVFSTIKCKMSASYHLSACNHGREVGRLEAIQCIITVVTVMGMSITDLSRFKNSTQDRDTILKIMPVVVGRTSNFSKIDMHPQRKKGAGISLLIKQLSHLQPLPIPLSARTIHCRLNKVGLYAQNVHCIQLKPSHHRARLCWCREHVDCDQEQQSRLMFSDKSHLIVTRDFNNYLVQIESGNTLCSTKCS